jgi:hypothetical protein
MLRSFEQASKLPRSQQEKIAAVIEAFVNQHSDREAGSGKGTTFDYCIAPTQ